ncbi:hypothetical protein N5923_23545 [Erwiniaceae bacterium BAC15a-03b]|uniref:Uncharacterized protein n=1 Tax=Winslowiella arboricola TaxID=2978220 RepID=A0A9J6Q2I7_9GAMM|nr:hypothetical protein [Winslowiella arboricola]MCU5775075.1 hypothetical protein [Winslowiella arboricola]MCU5780471.1 hypothetical protein [Winslowiella arboricola]
MKITIECSDITTRAGYRPGMMVAEIHDVTLQKFSDKELLGQIDIKEVFEWLNEQGYIVTQEAVA